MNILDDIEKYLEQREDVRDGGDRTPLPNDAMALLMRLREARRETPRHAPETSHEVHDTLIDAERYRWFRDQCSQGRKIEIAEYADHPAMLDHHIDKGRCGL